MVIRFEEKGQVYAINVPFHPIESSFADFCDFKTEEYKYLELNRLTQEEKRPGRRGNYSLKAGRQLVKALSQVVSGDLEQIPFSVDAQGEVAKLFDGYMIKPGDELSILRVYAHVVNTYNSYKPELIPEVYQAEVGGERYYLTGNAAQMLLGIGYTAGESFEVMEYQRRANLHVERTPDQVGNIEFNLGLTELALLLRKKGERLPSNETDRENFINERKQVFAEISLDQVFNLRFFLANLLLKTGRQKLTPISGTAPRAQPVKSRKRKRRGRRY